jgi:hypothetical protein
VNKMRVAKFVLPAVLVAALPSLSAQELQLNFGGAGWTQFGRIEASKVLDNINDYNKNWMQSGGGQINVSARFDETWDAGFGVGVVGVHLARGSRGQVNFWYPFWVPYVSEMRLTRTADGFTDGSRFQLILGNFGYGYNPDVKNLGQYLLRGYVYPGGLVSGFGNIFGAVARYEAGGLRNDLILKSENEDRPIYDFSIADVLTWRVRDGLEIGAGVNLYRVIAGTEAFRDPGTDCPIADGEQCFIVTPDGDTVTGSLAGTKLMARFSLDPKQLLGLEGIGGLRFGKSDLILYGEAGIIGLKDYAVHYDDIARRIPVMVGLNLPMMGALDYLSIEVEYYGSRNFSDVYYTGESGSWIPRTDGPAQNANTKRDDWKWSFNASKVIFGNLQLSGQVASDHLRPGGSNHSPSGVEAFSTPKDWYWNAKLAYFF